VGDIAEDCYDRAINEIFDGYGDDFEGGLDGFFGSDPLYYRRRAPGFTVTADDFDVVPEEPQGCRYCDGSGWFYGDRDIGPCSCAGVEDLI
jgi:hypothetical protein